MNRWLNKLIKRKEGISLSYRITTNRCTKNDQNTKLPLEHYSNNNFRKINGYAQNLGGKSLKRNKIFAILKVSTEKYEPDYKIYNGEA